MEWGFLKNSRRLLFEFHRLLGNSKDAAKELAAEFYSKGTEGQREIEKRLLPDDAPGTLETIIHMGHHAPFDLEPIHALAAHRIIQGSLRGMPLTEEQLSRKTGLESLEINSAYHEINSEYDSLAANLPDFLTLPPAYIWKNGSRFHTPGLPSLAMIDPEGTKLAANLSSGILGVALAGSIEPFGQKDIENHPAFSWSTTVLSGRIDYTNDNLTPHGIFLEKEDRGNYVLRMTPEGYRHLKTLNGHIQADLNPPESRTTGRPMTLYNILQHTNRALFYEEISELLGIHYTSVSTILERMENWMDENGLPHALNNIRKGGVFLTPRHMQPTQVRTNGNYEEKNGRIAELEQKLAEYETRIVDSKDMESKIVELEKKLEDYEKNSSQYKEKTHELEDAKRQLERVERRLNSPHTANKVSLKEKYQNPETDQERVKLARKKLAFAENKIWKLRLYIEETEPLLEETVAERQNGDRPLETCVVETRKEEQEVKVARKRNVVRKQVSEDYSKPEEKKGLPERKIEGVKSERINLAPKNFSKGFFNGKTAKPELMKNAIEEKTPYERLRLPEIESNMQRGTFNIKEPSTHSLVDHEYKTRNVETYLQVLDSRGLPIRKIRRLAYESIELIEQGERSIRDVMGCYAFTLHKHLENEDVANSVARLMLYYIWPPSQKIAAKPRDYIIESVDFGKVEPKGTGLAFRKYAFSGRDLDIGEDLCSHIKQNYKSTDIYESDKADWGNRFIMSMFNVNPVHEPEFAVGFQTEYNKEIFLVPLLTRSAHNGFHNAALDFLDTVYESTLEKQEKNVKENSTLVKKAI